MKKATIFLILILAASILSAAVTGVVDSVKVVTNGIVQICVRWSDGATFLDTTFYSVSSADSALNQFKNVELPKELARIIAKKNAGDYPADTIDTHSGLETESSVTIIKKGDVID